MNSPTNLTSYSPPDSRSLRLVSVHRIVKLRSAAGAARLGGGEAVLFTKGEQPCIVSDMLFLLFYYCHLKYRTMVVWFLLRVLEKQPFTLPVPWAGSVASSGSSGCSLPLPRETARRCGVALVVVLWLGDC